MQPEDFFDGFLTAHGVIKDWQGAVARQFEADIHACWRDGIGTLDESFVFDDGEQQTRVWTLTPSEDNSYVATAGDVVGEGLARWQLATGTTLLEGWVERLGRWVSWYFLAYLVLWSFIVGGALIGAMQEDSARVALQQEQPGVYETISKRDTYLLGSYQAIDGGKLAALPAEKKAEVEAVATPAKQDALSKMTVFPLSMLACYIGLMLYFRSRGGY